MRNRIHTGAMIAPDIREKMVEKSREMRVSLSRFIEICAVHYLEQHKNSNTESVTSALPESQRCNGGMDKSR